MRDQFSNQSVMPPQHEAQTIATPTSDLINNLHQVLANARDIRRRVGNTADMLFGPVPEPIHGASNGEPVVSNAAILIESINSVLLDINEILHRVN